MQERLPKLLYWGEIFFLLGIALLIVRRNTYPWPIKRASDILFLLTLLSVVGFALYARNELRIPRLLKPTGTALGATCLGLISATALSVIILNAPFGSEGILEFGRFVEAAGLLVLIGIFQEYDEQFYKKAAFAQLATIIYLPMLFTAQNNPSMIMPRFEFLENWPSNVAYSLLVSITLVMVWLLYNLRPKKRWWIYAPILIGYFGILLWAQSRASWLAIAATTLIVLLVWSSNVLSYRKRILRFLFGGIVIFIIVIAGFLTLPKEIKNIVLLRVFPSIPIDLYGDSPLYAINLVIQKKSPLAFEDTNQLYLLNTYSDRLYLWNAYSERILRQPWGLGVNYEPLNNGNGPKGPHNTILEVLTLGGPLALIGFLYLFALAFKNTWAYLRQTKNGRWPLYIFASLSALAIASLFDNMSTFRLMWIVLGLGIFYREKTTEKSDPNLFSP